MTLDLLDDKVISCWSEKVLRNRLPKKSTKESHVKADSFIKELKEAAKSESMR